MVFDTFAKSQMVIGTWVYFSVLYSRLLVYVSVFVKHANMLLFYYIETVA